MDYSPAFRQGFDARMKCDTKNPYAAGTPEHAEWLAGHNEANDRLAW